MALDDDVPRPVSGRVTMRREDREATASGIYGVIVGAAVMSASHAAKASAVMIAVLVTLIVYWGAERYARIVAERIHEGHRPSWTSVRYELTHGWEMVSASTLPLVTLAVMTLFRAPLDTAVLAALVCSTVLLGLAGWTIGRGGRLSTRERIVSTLVAGTFGALFVVLKALLH